MLIDSKHVHKTFQLRQRIEASNTVKSYIRVFIGHLISYISWVA